MPDIPSSPRLTQREGQVLRHVRVGRSNKDIAEDLGIGEQAVKALVSRLLLKYQVPNRTALAAAARGRRPDGETARPVLGDALHRSRELREQNRELIERIRVELRDLRHLRRTVVGRREDATSSRSPRGPQRAP